MKLATVLLAALLAACSAPAVPPVDSPVQTAVNAPEVVHEAVAASAPLPQAVEAASVLSSPVMAAVEALEPVTVDAPPPAPPETDNLVACRHAAAELIIRWEITGPGYYEKRLVRPVWPGGASGVTWGVGYDGGHQTARTIIDDWTAHDHVDRLKLTAGLTGERGKRALPAYRDIVTPYKYAAEVFETRSLIEYQRVAERKYRVDMTEVPVGVCAALISETYNRGGATVGDSRKEIRNIRDIRLPAKDWLGVAAEIRAMKRLWRGTINERGLSARRESEALVIEQLH